MASKKISALTSAGTLLSTDLIPIARSGQNYSTTPLALGLYTVPYKEYVANLTQASTSAPVAVVLNNTFTGTATWSYSSTGSYDLVFSSSPLTEDKTMVLIHNASAFGTSKTCAYWNGTNTITVETVNATNVHTNGYLNDTSIEIRVYNT